MRGCGHYRCSGRFGCDRLGGERLLEVGSQPAENPPPRRTSGGLGRQLRALTAPAAARKSRVIRRAPGVSSIWEGASDGLDAIGRWFKSRGWEAWPFQTEAWQAFRAGRDGLIQVPTGAGKTFGAYLGPLSALIDERKAGASGADAEFRSKSLRILYITPLRAVSRDIELALRAPIDEMALPFLVESRTGDTKQSVRAKQKQRLPEVLITTPESLCLLLTRENASELFADLVAIIVDEWHELLTSKRGTQVELCLARLRTFAPKARTWGLSATLPNLEEAARVLVGSGAPAPVIVRGSIAREVTVEALLPHAGQRLPWAGFMGMAMLPRVLETIDPAKSTLIFTNTRAQSELWYQAILHAKPEWAEQMALHHGSIDKRDRERAEAGLKDGTIKLAVATSSLDLGVDFSPVERVIQIGSVKGIARLLQRAGRASHRPGAPCHITCVPTHALELIELDAAKRAIADGRIEARSAVRKPLDVLAQHMVTCALGGDFVPDEFYEEVRGATSYGELTREEFDWALDLVCRGGETLRAYPHYHKVHLVDGRATVPDKRIAHLHRLNVGTIVGEAIVDLCLVGGRRIGSIEEYFVANLRAGDKLFFAGRLLTFVGLRDMVAYVKRASGKTSRTPHWAGTKLPISESLGESVRLTLEHAQEGLLDSVELRAAASLIRAQAHLSAIPRADELLIESVETNEGYHLFVFPFDGRLVHAGLAALCALRLARRSPATFTLSANDYGFELLSPSPIEIGPQDGKVLFSIERVLEDTNESVNMAELAKIQFREVARVSGLVTQTYPGTKKSGRQTQASAGLLYDVLREFDPGNLLLHQARREVLEKQFEETRLARVLKRLRDARIRFVRTETPTPLALPLIVERVAGQMSTEPLLARIERMQVEWETEPGGKGRKR
ncbi:MAG: ligase-associated DNA damage response DEXH box helicase [Phycisphaerae bacterium]|nr:ligase-associated DNA damage response DEXH box helicase [Phycisphaerae bacterium]